MGDFSKSFKKELGRAAGRRVANAVFGDKHASKHKLTIQREREERRKEREVIKAEKEYEKEFRREKREQERQQREYEREQKRAEIEKRKQLRADLKAQKEEEREYKRWLKEQERLEKEAELEENQNEYDTFINYIKAIQSIHKVPVDEVNWEDFLIEIDFIKDFKWSYHKRVINSGTFINYQDAILHLPWLVATTFDDDPDSRSTTLEEDDYLDTIIAENESFEFSRRILNKHHKWLSYKNDKILDDCIRALSKSPMIFKIKALGYMKKMAWVSQEDDENNNMSDGEWEFIKTTSEKLQIPFKLLRLSHTQDYINKSLDFVSKARSPFEEIGNYKEIPETRPNKYDSYFIDESKKVIISPLKKHTDTLIEDGTKKYGEKWIENDYQQRIDLINDQLLIHNETIKNNSFVNNLLFKKKIETAKNKIANLDKEKEALTEAQDAATEIADHIVLQIDLEKQLEQECNEFVSYWNDTWIEEFGNIQDRIHQHEIAKKVINNDESVYPVALKQVDRLDFVEDFGSSLSITFTGDDCEIDFYVNINDVVPTQKKTITQSRKLSTKTFTTSERNEIIQDYICSSILRISKEIFTVLPAKKIIVHAIDQILNTSTGHYEDGTLVSVILDKINFNNLNLDLIDPSDAIEGFRHNMQFNKSDGFKPVEKIKFVKSKSSSKKPSKEVKKQVPKEKESIKSKSSVSTYIRFSSSRTVLDIQNQFKELFNKKVIVLTPKGNTAGENRKLRSLTDKDLKTEIIVPIEKLTKKALKEVKKITGIHIDY